MPGEEMAPSEGLWFPWAPLRGSGAPSASGPGGRALVMFPSGTSGGTVSRGPCWGRNYPCFCWTPAPSTPGPACGYRGPLGNIQAPRPPARVTVRVPVSLFEGLGRGPWWPCSQGGAPPTAPPHLVWRTPCARPEATLQPSCLPDPRVSQGPRAAGAPVCFREKQRQSPGWGSQLCPFLGHLEQGPTPQDSRRVGTRGTPKALASADLCPQR